MQRCDPHHRFTADDVGDHSYYCEPHQDSGMADYHIVVEQRDAEV